MLFRSPRRKSHSLFIAMGITDCFASFLLPLGKGTTMRKLFTKIVLTLVLVGGGFAAGFVVGDDTGRDRGFKWGWEQGFSASTNHGTSPSFWSIEKLQASLETFKTELRRSTKAQLETEEYGTSYEAWREYQASKFQESDASWEEQKAQRSEDRRSRIAELARTTGN